MRIAALFSILPLCTGALSAQCINTTGGVNAGLVATTTWPADDEGRSAPIDMLFGPAGFPMAGATGPLTHAVIGSNGEIYLTNGGAAVGPVDFGAFDVSNLRGVAGDSPRIWPRSDDLQGVSGSYAVEYDTSVAGQFRVLWNEVQPYGSSNSLFSMTATLFNSGVVEFSYSDMPLGNGVAGVSIGNGVGTGLETSVDLTAGPDSGTLGMIYQAFDFATPASVAGHTITLIPNGNGGFLSVVTCSPASHKEIGVGCYAGGDTFYELFPDAVAASAGLQGNAMLLTPNPNGYTANWLPGAATALFVPPTGAATSLPLTNDGSTVVNPSVPFPIPGGSTASLTVEHNGIIDAAATANHDFDFTVIGSEVAAASNLAFYSFSDFFDSNTTPVPSGTIKTEEVGGIFYVTWDAVDHWATPFVSCPSTFQFQFNLTSGTVTIAWITVDTDTTSTDGTWWLVGCSAVGSGSDPGSIALATALPVSVHPPTQAMTLSAAPPPVINPSTLVTYSAGNLGEFQPGSSVYLSTLFLSVNPIPGGFDLTGILTGTPGCSAYIASLDLDLGAQVTLVPTASWNLLFSNVYFAPGNVVAAQAVCLYDPAFPLPNGEAGGFLFSNGVVSTTN